MATWTAILVVAFTEGGPALAGVASAVQLVPAGIAALVGGALADRWHRGRLLVVGHAAAAVLCLLVGIALLIGSPFPAVLALGAALSVPFALLRPTQSSLVPEVAADAHQVVAANGSLGMASATSYIVGPLAAGVLLLVGPSAVFWVMAVLGAIGTVAAVRAWAIEEAEVSEHDRTWGGMADLVGVAGARTLLAIGALFQFTFGALDVLVVTYVLDELGLDDAAVGYLGAVLGVGGMVGATWVLGLAGRRRLAGAIVVAASAWGIPIAFLGLVPGVVIGSASILIAGLGNVALGALLPTLIQRVAPPHLMSRAFGAAEGLRQLALAVGALVAGVAVVAVGFPVVAMGVGLLVPIGVASWSTALRRIDEGVDVPWDRVAALSRVPLLATLSTRALEGLAATAGEEVVAGGSVVVEEGADGDCCYVVVEGSVEVRRDRRVVAELGPGDIIGEIALLRAVPRTATATTLVDSRLLRIDRDDFLGALDANRVATGIGADLVGGRLAELDDL